MKTLILRSAALALAVAAAGCAARPPSQELVAARAAYEDARRGPAASLAPDSLLAAKQALDKAEAEHADDAQSAEEKHFAYIAERVANLADSHGKIALHQREGMLAAQEVSRLQDERRRMAEREAEEAQSELTAGRVELQGERAARLAAEQKLRAALQSLEEIAQIKEEARGMVITLNGSVLFATDKSELLPSAKTRLDEVAQALQDLRPGQTIVVEGHTDSVGADDYNQKLSQARATSVRDYLVSRGVSQSIISAVGRGEAVPVAQNTTPEGRANNRRVEIIISPAGRTGTTGGASTPPGSSAPGTTSPGSGQGTPPQPRPTN